MEQKTKKEATRDRKKAAFLAAVSKHLTISEAAKRCGISRRTVLNWRNEDPDFDRLIFEAQEPLYDELEATGLERALNRPDPKTGERPFDERTAFLYWVAILKARRHQYRDSHKPELNIGGDLKFTFQMSRPEELELSPPRIINQLPELPPGQSIT